MGGFVRLIRVLPVFGLLALGGCPHVSPPVVQQQTVSAVAGSTRIVAVMPFTHRTGLIPVGAEAGMSAEEVADLVAGFMAEALRAEGVGVVAPSDMRAAFLNQGLAVPRRDPRAAAETAARKFGATSVVVGEVLRWRERRGRAYGAEQTASVAYEMSLYRAPVAHRLWNSRFDHTQRTLSADPLTARQYPGGGMRFLTAAELARWGIRSSASSLVEGQWRAAK